MTDKGNLNRISHRSFDALKWNYLGTGTKLLSQFMIGIVLARLLGPEAYGVVAIAWLALGLGNLVADLGLASALIQRSEICDRDIRYVFTLQVATGFSLSLAVVVAAPLISVFFGRPDCVNIMRAMGVLFLLQSLGQTGTALLKRDLNFRWAQICQVSTYLLAYLGVGIPLAYAGMGAWALVAAQLSQATLYSLAILGQVRHPLRPTFEPEHPGFFRFGAKVLASNLTSWSSSNLDAVIIGRVFGVVNLGLYNRAMNLVNSPMNAFVSTLQGVLFSSYSRVQGQPATIRNVYFSSVCITAAILFPIFFSLGAIPTTVIVGVYGESWRQAAPLMAALALAMPVNALLALGGPLLMGVNRAGQDASVQAFGTVVLVCAVLAASSVSFALVPWAVLVSYLVRFLLVTTIVLRYLGARWFDVGRSLLGPAILGIICAFIARISDIYLTGYLSSGAVRLAVIGIEITLFCLFIFGLLGGKMLSKESYITLEVISERLPFPLRTFVHGWSRIRA
jgi:PST family polysaccharide transporter